MKHISMIKFHATLRKMTGLVPVIRNATRWSSMFAMPERYNKLHLVLRSLYHAMATKHCIPNVVLMWEEAARADDLLQTLKEVNEVTKVLQGSTLTLVDARRAFDLVAIKYPRMAAHPENDASNPDLLDTKLARKI